MRDLLGAIDAHRTRHNARNCRCSEDRSHYGVSLEEIADAYGAALKAQGAIDFPGMLLSLAELLDDDEWVLEHFRALYRHILVDEGQDLTAIQTRLLRQLAGDSINLFVVADDRQSIRGYAGGAFSHAEALVPVAARTPLHLHHNFRCATRILRAAEAVLQPMAEKRRVEAPEHAPPGNVRFRPMSSPEAEADWIVSWILKLLGSGLGRDTVAEGEDPSVVPEDIAVAARTRWALAPLVESLTRQDIGFVAQTDAKVFLSEPEARLFVDCLAFGVNDRDSPAARQIAEEFYELTGGEVGADPLATLHTVDNDALRSVAELVTRSLRGGDDLEKAMSELAAAGRFHDWPKGSRTLSDAWQEYRATTTLQSRTPQGFLAHVARIQRTRPTDPGVRLLTIDRAKGLGGCPGRC